MANLKSGGWTSPTNVYQCLDVHQSIPTIHTRGVCGGSFFGNAWVTRMNYPPAPIWLVITCYIHLMALGHGFLGQDVGVVIIFSLREKQSKWSAAGSGRNFCHPSFSCSQRQADDFQVFYCAALWRYCQLDHAHKQAHSQQKLHSNASPITGNTFRTITDNKHESIPKCAPNTQSLSELRRLPESGARLLPRICLQQEVWPVQGL